MRIVKDDGLRTAKIVVVGEQPGSTEDRTGVPFSGPAGAKLDRWIFQAGLTRRDVYVTNVVPYFRKQKLKGIDKQEISFWTKKLHERLDALVDPQIIVPVGNAALRAVLPPGRTYDKKSKQRLTVTKARGFVFDSEISGRLVRTIPTIHPAYVMRDPSAERACELDWQRIAREAQSTISKPLTFRHNIRPSLRTVADWVDEAIEQGGPVSLDIETVAKPEYRILCIGWSWDGKESYVVPVADRRYWPERMQERVVRQIRRLCESDVPKVLQNGLYDQFWLWMQYGIKVRNARWDLRWMHHFWLPQDFAHDLAYMASTELPLMRYWKDEAKNAEESAKYASDFDALQSYCGIDNCVQRRLVDPLREKLERTGKLDLYLRHYAELAPHLLSIMTHGVPVDQVEREETAQRIVGEAVAAGWEAMRVAERSLLGKGKDAKKISDAELKKLLYQEWELKKIYDRETGSLTVKEVALRKLKLGLERRKRPNRRAVSLIDAVLEHRRKFQLSLFARGERVDPDDRVRCSYGMTETLRLTSSKSPYGTGTNTQNQDREIRGIYTALPGHILIEMDQSTAEDRLVKILTGDPRLIEQALAMPWEFDAHTDTASIIYKIPVDVLMKRLAAKDKEAGVQRYFAKRTNHAGNYGMAGMTMSEEILKDGYVLTPEECDRMLEAKHARYPAIRQWHRAIERLVLREEEIRNSWGWKWTIEARRLGPAAYREAYAFVPQSEVGMLTNEFGVKPLGRLIERRGLRTRILIQGHDSLVLSAPPEEAWRVVSFVRASMGRARRYGMPGQRPVELAMPIELKIGTRWDWRDGSEWKRWPSREEFEARVTQLLSRVREEEAA